MQITKKEKLYLFLIGLVTLAIVLVTVFSLMGRKTETAAAVPTRSTDPLVVVDMQEVEKIVEVEKLVEVEKVISAGILQDGLRDMGVLVTGEYYFTEVINYSSMKKLWKVALPFTESSYLASYDGVVTAGIDFSAITVEKDDENVSVTVHIPAAEIRNIDIDPNTLMIYSEKTGMGNPVSLEDFNRSLIDMENTARSKAIERGLLTRANQHAKSVISNFVGSLVDLSRYTLLIVD